MTSQKARFSTQRQQQSCIVLCNTRKTLYSYIVTVPILSRQPQEDTENGGVLSSEMDGEKIAFRFGFEGKSINYAKKSKLTSAKRIKEVVFIFIGRHIITTHNVFL